MRIPDASMLDNQEFTVYCHTKISIFAGGRVVLACETGFLASRLP
jgi:hypothetical protein